MSKIGSIIKMTARVGERDALVAQLLETAQAAQGESGTEIFTVNVSMDEADVVWIYESYTDEAAQKAHQASDVYADSKRKTDAMLSRTPELFALTPMGGEGLN